MPGPSLLDEDALSYYVGLGRKLAAPAVLMPTADLGVLFMARHREALAPYFQFHVPTIALLDTIISKRRLVALARRHDLPIPPTVVPESRLDLERALDRLEFPCIIKPEFTHLWRAPKAVRAGLAGTKAIPAATPAELLSLYDRLAAVDPNLVVQKMVVGPDENHLDYNAFVDAAGSIRAEFLDRKLRLFPSRYGSGSYVESVHCEETRAAGRSILSRLGYQGVANLDFKRDEQDGRLYLLEINPRFWTSTGLAMACGLDFPFYSYQECLGAPYTVPATYPARRRWLHPLNDLRGMRTRAGGGWSWARWLANFLSHSTDAVFAWDDPRPAWHLLAQLLRDRIGGWQSSPVRATSDSA